MEFTPVDSCAEAIVKIIENNPKFTVLHLFDNKFIKICDILKILKSLKQDIEFVSDDEFKKRVNIVIKDKKDKDKINGIITDLDENKLLNLINYIIPNSEFTQKYLEMIGFEWPEINEEYIKKYIEYFKKIKFI